MNIIIVAGARPNFMKVAPIIKALEAAISTCVHNYFVSVFLILETLEVICRKSQRDLNCTKCTT